MAIKEHPIKLPLDLILAQGNEFLMRCSKGSKYVRTEHRTESNLEPFDTGSVRTGTLVIHHFSTCMCRVFWCLAQHSAEVTRSDTPFGSKPPHLQLAASKSQYVRRGDPVAIDLFCSLIFTVSITEIQLCKVNY